MSFFLSVRPTGDLGDVYPPFESLSLPCTELALLPIMPGESPVYPDFRSPKSSEPFFDAISVFEKFGLNRSPYPPLERLSGCIKLLCCDGTLNYSSKLYDCFGLIVLPRPLYFSPLGDLGGVNPFCVGEPGYFCILVINNGDGGADNACPGYPLSSSVISRFIS